MGICRSGTVGREGRPGPLPTAVVSACGPSLFRSVWPSGGGIPAASLCPNVSSARGNVGAPRPSSLGFGHHEGALFQWREGFRLLQHPLPEPSQVSGDPPQGSYLKGRKSFNPSLSILPAVAFETKTVSTLSPLSCPSHKNLGTSQIKGTHCHRVWLLFLGARSVL